MTEFLETTVDKFRFRVAKDRYYNDQGVWAKEDEMNSMPALAHSLIWPALSRAA
jgi:hypothetical protein